MATEWIDRDANEVPDYAAMLRLDGQVHVVLGAGLGIGRQSSHAFSSVGATVVCVDRDQVLAERVAAEVRGIPWSGDITNRESVEALVEFVDERCGRLDGVVDIVGLARYKALIELTDDDWLFHQDTVLKHAYLALQYSARYWQRTGSGGTVSFVASVAGTPTSSPKLGAYGAMKAALISLVRTAAVELGPDGIRVNAVAPGVIRTARQQANPEWTRELLAANVDRTPLRKLAHPSDIASVLLFLSSPLAGHVTGQTILVDGGNSIVPNIVARNP